MLAKGHDFPNVTLVGVVSADAGLAFPDFRSAERTFQLLTQVAGRAGRGAMRGEAIVQTLYPDHYSIRHACRQDYAAFYHEEINYRRSMRYPPAVALINVVVRGRTHDAAMQDAGQIVRALRWGGEPYRVLGPAPAPLSRLKGEHRTQFFIKNHMHALELKAGKLGAKLKTELRASPDFDDLMLLRCGAIDAPRYLALLAKTANGVLVTPGRRVQSLAQASFDAWIKYYRPDENTPNAVVNYYTKGALVALGPMPPVPKLKNGSEKRL